MTAYQVYNELSPISGSRLYHPRSVGVFCIGGTATFCLGVSTEICWLTLMSTKLFGFENYKHDHGTNFFLHLRKTL